MERHKKEYLYLLNYKRMKEKSIEKIILHYLESIWSVVEWMQWWKIMIVKWKYKHRMTLQKDWCPDIVCFYKWRYIWIEVKKNIEEVEAWLKIEKRFHWKGKPLPDPYFDKSWKLKDSYQREKDQIKYKENIIKNWWTFMLTCELQDVVDYIEVE